MAAETRQDSTIELPSDITEEQFEAYKQLHSIGDFRKSRTPGHVRVSFKGRKSHTSGRVEANTFYTKYHSLGSLVIAQNHKSVLFPEATLLKLWDEIRQLRPSFQQSGQGESDDEAHQPGQARVSAQTSINSDTPGNTPGETPGADGGPCCIML